MAAPAATKPKLDKDQDKKASPYIAHHIADLADDAATNSLYSNLLQDFLKVFEQLRDELVNDDLLGAQPDASKQWVKEVCRIRLIHCNPHY